MSLRSLLHALAAVLVIAVVMVVPAPEPVRAQDGGSYARISGEGSSWAAVAIDDMRRNVKQFGITVDYTASGSTAGRTRFLQGIVDFAASDIPFQRQPEDGSRPELPELGSYAYIPVTAGGTAFMYNLRVNGRQVTNLRLSGENVAKIFTGAITEWNDPALAADNPGLDLPARRIVPVVRADGSGSTAQFTAWLVHRHNGLWQAYCGRVGRAQCGETSFYPATNAMLAKTGDFGVAEQIKQSSSEGAIGYVNYSYALNNGFPVAKVLNAAGYYTEPSPENVAVSLLKAKINRDESNLAVYLTQDLSGVYTDADPRNYQLSSYSYFILPTKVQGQFTAEKGRALGAFAYYAMCQAQERSASLGYSPIPINLVDAAFEQIRLIPGVEVQSIDIRQCHNPTFSTDGTNTLAQHAAMPFQCDARGNLQCPFGTAGAPADTAVKASASGGQARLGATGGSGGTGGAGGTTGGTGGTNGATGDTSGTGGTGGTTGVTPGGGPDGAADGGVVCDVETGICEGGTGGELALGADGGAAGPGAEGGSAAASSTVLAASSGWDATQTLIVVVVVLMLALIIGPALLWTRLSDPEAGS